MSYKPEVNLQSNLKLNLFQEKTPGQQKLSLKSVDLILDQSFHGLKSNLIQIINKSIILLGLKIYSIKIGMLLGTLILMHQNKKKALKKLRKAKSLIFMLILLTEAHLETTLLELTIIRTLQDQDHGGQVKRAKNQLKFKLIQLERKQDYSDQHFS